MADEEKRSFSSADPDIHADDIRLARWSMTLEPRLLKASARTGCRDGSGERRRSPVARFVAGLSSDRGPVRPVVGDDERSARFADGPGILRRAMPLGRLLRKTYLRAMPFTTAFPFWKKQYLR